MTVVLEPDASQRSILQAMLHGSTAFADLGSLDEHIRSAANEFAVVIGPSVPSEAAAELAQWARVHRPDLGVILLRHEVDSTALSLALRSGMREVVAARDLAGITTAVQRARSVANAIGQTILDEAQAAAEFARAQAAAEIAEAAAVAQAEADAPRGKVLTVFSTKGGVGKSLVATNLGVCLAAAGRSVCLVDLDVTSGDVAIMLQLTPQRTINDLVGFNGVIDAEGISSILTHHSDNLAVVAAPVRIDTPDQASQEDVAKLIDALRRMVDFVVVDTSGTFDDFALSALDRSDGIILVGTLDIPSLKALKLAASTLEVLNFPKSTWRFVLNRADGKVGLTVEEYEKTLGLKADSSLVSSREVLAAVNRGEALVTAYPNHPNSKALVAFAKSVAASIGEPANADESTPSSRKPSGSRLRLRRA
ncbi:AAA family ATPase [Nocardioides xinjiangensis]|uniref:AAA family ATPase n=1 Tax=Nocardioides xinjiangensis TaxID=2817376 RepID=UPI001B300F65|nr:P-loop NTPase [Nocardioides sp. SYSU D00514]